MSDSHSIYIHHPDPEHVETVLDELLEEPALADGISMTDVEPGDNGWSILIDGGPLAEHNLVKALATRLNCVAVSIWEYDSDVWGYILYDKGQLIDQHVADPDYIAALSPDETGERMPTGNPELLAPYVPGGFSAAQRMINLRPEFAEDAVAEFAQLIMQTP